MNTLSKENIQIALETEYAIHPEILEKSVWGYRTVGFYVQAGADKYIVKVTPYSPEKLTKCKKDVLISGLLSADFPTPRYLKNSRGEHVTTVKDYILRVADYIEGTQPFDMNPVIYKQLLGLLGRLHKASIIDPDLEVLENTHVFLHGDPTPSNIIVADHKIVGILDFEDSLCGPVEYDLAKGAVFSWFRMKGVDFKEVIDLTLKEYPGKVNRNKLLSYCVSHASNHLSQIISNKESYDNRDFWQDDYDFSCHALEEIKDIANRFDIDSPGFYGIMPKSK